ncbi:MAG: DUF262 domain-containing protein [Candidatus Sungbacteria bacterium]|nr:DUF262 domain-containing protein [Candidatus Sungbacteria bacterium]
MKKKRVKIIVTEHTIEDEQTASDLVLEKLQSEERDSEEDVASYKIRTYGADYTLEVLVKQLSNGDIYVPTIQRKYVWPERKASKLIESFLLGLPVPQVFLYKEGDEKLIVVDGQQRLKTILYYLRGSFENGAPFRLKEVHSPWNNKLFAELSDADKRKLNNTVLRATVFEQIDPQDKRSIYEIFYRLNTGGMPLNQQEIRNAVIQGEINSFLHTLNQCDSWRKLLKRPTSDTRMKDIEMILRFFALYYGWRTYKKPMKDFITDFMKSKSNISEGDQEKYKNIFIKVMNTVYKKIGKDAFRIKAGINVALFDAVSVGVASILLNKNDQDLKKKYNKLKTNESFKSYISTGTTDIDKVQGRIRMAIKYLGYEKS